MDVKRSFKLGDGFRCLFFKIRTVSGKIETSGQYQIVKEICLDCDNDALLLFVEQKKGIACHTGRPSCFFRKLSKDGWETIEADMVIGGEE